MRLRVKKSTTVQSITLRRDPGKHTSSCLGFGAFAHPKQREIADVERQCRASRARAATRRRSARPPRARSRRTRTRRRRTPPTRRASRAGAATR
eukprot:7406758-Alexandrium_andersonii.AAC.1